MRRRPSQLTVWPAFADLMTVFAVVGLLGAILVLGALARANQQIDVLNRQIAKLNATIATLRAELDDERARRLAAEKKLLELTGRGDPSCLSRPDGRTQPLLRLTAGDGVSIEPIWPPADNERVVTVSGLSDLVNARRMDLATFLKSAQSIYDHGRLRPDVFGGRPCRFFVELKRGAGSQAEYINAYRSLQRFFLLANWDEATRNLTASD